MPKNWIQKMNILYTFSILQVNLIITGIIDYASTASRYLNIALFIVAVTRFLTIKFNMNINSPYCNDYS